MVSCHLAIFLTTAGIIAVVLGGTLVFNGFREILQEAQEAVEKIQTHEQEAQRPRRQHAAYHS